MKIPNKRKLQQIAYNHSSDIDFKNFMKMSKSTITNWHVKYSKLTKTTSKTLNDEEHRQSENEELKLFESVILLLLKLFFDFFFSVDESCSCLTRFCRKNFFNGPLDEK